MDKITYVCKSDPLLKGKLNAIFGYIIQEAFVATKIYNYELEDKSFVKERLLEVINQGISSYPDFPSIFFSTEQAEIIIKMFNGNYVLLSGGLEITKLDRSSLIFI